GWGARRAWRSCVGGRGWRPTCTTAGARNSSKPGKKRLLGDTPREATAPEVQGQFHMADVQSNGHPAIRRNQVRPTLDAALGIGLNIKPRRTGPTRTLAKR